MTITRKVISAVDKKRLVETYSSGDDWRTLAVQFGIKVRSAEGIIGKFKQSGQISTGKWGGHKPKLITYEVGSQLISFVEENILATLIQMQQFIEERFAFKPSLKTISVFLDNKCLSLKLVRDIPSERNSDRVIELRYNYAKFMMDNCVAYKDCIYIDET